jgi:predicted ATPase
VETEFPVQPLALPTERDPGVAALAASPAGALFTARARAVSPGFAVTGDNVAAVAAICRRLAGIPLAIELAAARLRYLEPEILLARLDDAMARDGARDLPARQRTMRATIDWSYQLLDPAEQQLFRRLSVFTGGFTLDAAEHVGACPSPDQISDGADVLGRLEALVEQSLVLVTRDGGRLRYGMLEPIAQYAGDLLDRTEEAPQVHAAHATYYLHLAERAAPHYRQAEQLDWLARMDPETANTTLAIERSLDHHDSVTAARLCWALWLFWWLRGHLLLGRRLTDATLAHEHLHGATRARTLAAAGAMGFALGDTSAAGRLWEQAFDLAIDVGDRTAAAHSLPSIGIVALATGDLRAAEATLTRALALAADVGTEAEWAAGLAHIWLGTVRMLRGDPVAAIGSIEHGLASARRRGDRLTSYIALYNLAQAALTQGDRQRARGHLHEGIKLSQQTRDVANLAYFFELLAVVDAAPPADPVAVGPADRAIDDAGHEHVHDTAHMEAARVATLLGAAQTLREAAGAAVYGYYRPDEALTRQAAGHARATLGDDGYDDLVDSGRALDLDDAVAYALQVTPAPAADTTA